MGRFVGLVTLCVGLAVARGAHAGGLEYNLDLSLNSPAKNVTMATFGAVLAAGLGGTLYWEIKAASAKGERDGLGDPHDFCGGSYDAQACQKWTQSRADQNAAARNEIPYVVLIGAGLTGAAVTAFFWPNDPPPVKVGAMMSPSGGGFNLVGNF
jgi:hypothetical protein